MRASQSGLVFFLDRGLGSRVVPEMLRTAGWLITTMDERYGVAESQAVPDIEWLTTASEREEVILCKDLAIAKNPLEADTVYRVSARVFGLSNAQLTGTQSGNMFLHHEEALVMMALRAAGPYVVSVSVDGLHRRRLNLPG